jgi:hypothetical protein
MKCLRRELEAGRSRAAPSRVFFHLFLRFST